MATDPECFISVDVETAGPIPGEYSMLSIGACVVGRADEGFYAELRPINTNAVPEALAVSGFDLSQLARDGEPPSDAIRKLSEWVQAVRGGATPVFVGFNAGFDWSFVNWYFHQYAVANPFGFAPLDIKAFFMGMTGCRWDETKSSKIPPQFQPDGSADHNALNDARAQAEMFAKMLVASGAMARRPS